MNSVMTTYLGDLKWWSMYFIILNGMPLNLSCSALSLYDVFPLCLVVRMKGIVVMETEDPLNSVVKFWSQTKPQHKKAGLKRMYLAIYYIMVMAVQTIRIWKKNIWRELMWWSAKSRYAVSAEWKTIKRYRKNHQIRIMNIYLF